uniref:Uncharacterized protein n=2 Tax=Picea TaxID=3328 RepID=A0A124GN10_PICGL|nr:hypothetical protein ABT39_MTgene5543 [Picea glauca]QHR91657.1 hypothetical protein Q903MT_gene5693 [Picea sitchensis]
MQLFTLLVRMGPDPFQLYAYFRKSLSECSLLEYQCRNWNDRTKYEQPGPLVVIDRLEC